MGREMRVLARREKEGRSIAVLQEGRLMEYYQEAQGEDSWVGAVLLGRVERVLPQVGAAFVDIGQKKSGFLPLTEMESFQVSGHGKPLVTGQDVVVQVKKDAKDEKGAFLTRDIALPGRYCIYMPLNRHVGVSGRMTNEEKEKARALGQEIAGGQAGMIMRHAALFAQPQEVREEYEALADIWQDIQQKAPFAKAPGLLFREESALAALQRDYTARFDVSVAQSGEGGETELTVDALWQGARVPQQLAQALERRVDLPGGGTLVIDEREALTTIDVNTAHFTGDGQGEIALRQNLAACGEIARQIRLRNLCGILLIDFIDMKTEEDRAQVREALKSALTEDRIKTVIHGFTSLGLLEMTRKRTRESLRDLLTQPCGACQGSGRKGKEPHT